MDTVKIIDTKGLPHHEREGLVFPSLEALKTGQVLNIIFEFNPLPLVYTLKAQEKFEVSYEKEGPPEWVLRVKRLSAGEDKKQHLKELLNELRQGEVSEETKQKAKILLQTVDATTLGLMEQELIREGVSHDQIRKSLCDIHLEVMKDALVSKRIEVSAPHPVHTFMEEHKIILNHLHELGSLMERLHGMNDFDDLGEDLERLADIAHHLIEAERHHQREEEVLFPKLIKHDIVEPPEIMKLDHAEFRKRKQQLYELVHNHRDCNFRDFKDRVIELGGYLTKELESHIFKEDNILYQIALGVLSPQEWQEIKKGCDKIGYCCFTPQDHHEGH